MNGIILEGRHHGFFVATFYVAHEIADRALYIITTYYISKGRLSLGKANLVKTRFNIEIITFIFNRWRNLVIARQGDGVFEGSSVRAIVQIEGGFMRENNVFRAEHHSIHVIMNFSRQDVGTLANSL